MQHPSNRDELPLGATRCPARGAVVSFPTPQAEVSHDAQAVVQPSESVPSPTPVPLTDYGFPPYGTFQQNPHELTNPYTAPASPAQLPPTYRSKVRIGLILGVAVILIPVLLLASLGVAAFTKPPLTWPVGTSAAPLSLSTFALSATRRSMPYPPFTGTLVLNDPLRDNSLGNNWDVTNNSSFRCTFTARTYHSTTEPGYLTPCAAQNTNFSNFAYEVQMKLLRGDCGGLLFRLNNSTTNFYHFRVCWNGTYRFTVYKESAASPLTGDISTPAIKAGYNRTNLLAVVANGGLFDFYINHQHVGHISDGSYSQGEIAVFAGGGYGDQTEAAFSNAKVWQLSVCRRDDRASTARKAPNCREPLEHHS